jgi:phage replication-related protein YjqB (UPF0714/DUF867 family)
MAEKDKYETTAELFAATRKGRDYRVHVRATTSAVAIVAPHGGCIEPGTFEVAEAIAGENHNFYCFEAITDGLHLTSHKFDDPECIRLVEASDHVVSIHGCQDNEANGVPDLTVAIGGLDKRFGSLLLLELARGGFAIGDSKKYPGEHPRNICNRGRRGMGVQLELSRSLRDRLMESRTDGVGSLFANFAAVIERAIRKQTQRH